MAKYSTLGALFTAIANSLRSKTGGSSKIVADDFPAKLTEEGAPQPEQIKEETPVQGTLF